MAETKHTPGPWRVHFNARAAALPGHIIETDDDVRHPIALLWEGGGTKGKPRQIANAHLIAAAPELLEALYNFLMEGRGYSDETWAGMKRAIAKAEGRA